MLHSSTISAFHGVLGKFELSASPDAPFPEVFAVKRFLKKFQTPNRVDNQQLKQQCWDHWLSYDSQLNRVKSSDFKLFGALYRARQTLHLVSPVRYDTCDLPQGSEFIATRGQNSIESRLQRSHWTCTYDNFEQFALFVYNCKAMKRAFRQRYLRWYSSRNFVEPLSSMDKYIFRRYRSCGVKNPAWETFCYKLSCITTFTQGSRFTTVPKNNEVDRPINIEPLGNMVVQRQIGNFLRTQLKKLFSVDLDVLALQHRDKIRCADYATIDLKDASDSVTLTLCEFLLPRHLFKELLKSRSEFVLGLDGQYHKTNKISSMGNGFTFELMSLILTAVARAFDKEATVFGDDIIIRNEFATDLIRVLEGIGFRVNVDKSFINSKFRESCGANFHDDYGYIESFDFRWPNSIHDCVVFYNKALRLSKLYPSFEKLYLQLRRHIPSALQGVLEPDFFERRIEFPTRVFTDPPELSNFFRVRPHSEFKLKDVTPSFRRKLEAYARRYNYNLEDLKVFSGYSYKEKLRSNTLRHLKSHHYGKYEMYLYAGRKAKDALTGYGDWVTCYFLSVAGATMRWSDSALK